MQNLRVLFSEVVLMILLNHRRRRLADLLAREWRKNPSLSELCFKEGRAIFLDMMAELYTVKDLACE